MKIVVALDKFKGSLTAPAACEIVRRALLTVHPGAQIIVKPMADGGDGTADALHAALGGEWISQTVTGPLPTTGRATLRRGQRLKTDATERVPPEESAVTARYLWLADSRRAFIEMAQASGLVLLQPAQRNPLLTTTYGTGELIADAIRRGADRIWLAIGGSATTDGGIGAAAALGWQFRDAQGQPVAPVGGELTRIVSILPTPATNYQPPITVEVLCDVDNPLCGEHGAARVFGPQKGATPAMVEQLDNGLRHLAGIVKAQLGKDILDLPGAGAAGGLGGGAVAFLNARLVPGIETVMTASRLAEDLAGADWVITGEGQFDEQSLRGKVVAGVTTLAQKHGVKVAVLAGRVKLNESDWRRAGISSAHAIAPAAMRTAEAMQRAAELLAQAAGRILIMSS